MSDQHAEPRQQAELSGEQPENALVNLELSRNFLAARNGDRAAFSCIYRHFASTVHGILLARIGPADAEDLLQETFLKIFKALPELRDIQSLPAWICSVARNLATDQQRKQARRPERSEQSAALLEGIAGPSDESRELGQRVWQRIQELPETYRETLVLRLVEGLSGPEIAARTGLTAASLRVKLCRGMAMLRPLLQKDGWS